MVEEEHAGAVINSARLLHQFLVRGLYFTHNTHAVPLHSLPNEWYRLSPVDIFIVFILAAEFDSVLVGSRKSSLYGFGAQIGTQAE